jgi:hypothetical protein
MTTTRQEALEAGDEALAFAHVPDVAERAITRDGRTITFAVPLVQRSTGYGTERVQQRLAELLQPADAHRNQIPRAPIPRIVTHQRVRRP